MPHRPHRPLLWSEAIEQALYGPGGFYHRPEGPAGHFRTSVHASPLFAAAIFRLIQQVDSALGHSDRFDLVDVGAGRGELFQQLAPLLDTTETGLHERIRLHAVERAERPAGAASHTAWTADLPEDVVGLIVANEYLDNVPLDVVEVASQGLQRVLVVPSTGEESPGGPIGLRDAAWLAKWWPLDLDAPGARAEVGTSRDRAWASVVASLTRGVVVAIDYGHLRADRAAGAYPAGTLVGYREGRATSPIPDGSCDLTAHVAIDACAQAGLKAGATSSRLIRQRAALAELGISGRLPPVALAGTDPAAYARELTAASQAAELRDPSGLGGFWWLTQTVGFELLPRE